MGEAEAGLHRWEGSYRKVRLVAKYDKELRAPKGRVTSCSRHSGFKADYLTVITIAGDIEYGDEIITSSYHSYDRLVKFIRRSLGGGKKRCVRCLQEEGD